MDQTLNSCLHLLEALPRKLLQGWLTAELSNCPSNRICYENWLTTSTFVQYNPHKGAGSGKKSKHEWCEVKTSEERRNYSSCALELSAFKYLLCSPEIWIAGMLHWSQLLILLVGITFSPHWCLKPSALLACPRSELGYWGLLGTLLLRSSSILQNCINISNLFLLCLLNVSTHRYSTCTQR